MKLIVALTVLAAAWVPAEALACATCGCGDMTLTLMGSEKPFAGRLRAALEYRHRSDTIGTENLNEQALSENRLDLQLVWAPLDRLVLLLDVPALQRNVRYVNLAERETTGLGEIQLLGKFFIFQDDPFVPRHLVAVTGGVKLPTANLERGPDGALLPVELQPGTGSVDPIMGLAYGFFADPWSVYASATFILTTRGDDDYRASRSLRTTTALQYQFVPAFALRGGVDTRTDSTALENGAQASDTGGFIGFATLEALWSPGMDWLLYAAARVPVVNALDGRHDEGAYISTGVAFDFF